LNTEIKELKYWIGFSRIPGIGRVKISQLLDYFHSLENAWSASTADLKNAGLDSKVISNLQILKNKITLDSEIDNLEKYNIKAIPYNSPDYPPRLKEIHDYPPILFIRGNLLQSDEISISIVGTRKATSYGKQVTENIVGDLAKNGITIISGLAKGIDSIAHRAALEAGGRTLAIFASGLDIVYPAENASLARKIMESGALISEYPIGTKPKADNFPRRNRILSGLSLGVLVVEAGEKSGALITADMALEQNREVFAIPGNIYSPLSTGTNRLIQRGGAKLVSSYVDMLEELNLAQVARQLEIKELLPVNDTEQIILRQLGAEPRHIDDVCRNSGLSTATVISTIAMMELKGLIKQTDSMCYVVSNR
jgi:DNA processing protein